MGERTEPGAPPDATPKYARPADAPTDPDADLAASLLNDLARTSLPTNGIPETSGQNAAAYAVSARRPPRAMEDVTLEPAVVVNLTEPFPMALTPLPTAASRDEATLVGPRRATDPNDPRGRRTMPAMRAALSSPPRALQKTVLGPRAQRRQVLFGIMSVIGIATLVALGILAFVPRMRRSAVSPTATSELTAASTDGVTVVTSTATALPTPTIAPPLEPAPPVTAVASAPPPVVTVAPAAAPPRPTARVTGSSRPAAAPKVAPPKPAGTFEEPDRSF